MGIGLNTFSILELLARKVARWPRREEHHMGDKTRGLYQKFVVTRTDGSSAPGGKHEGCEYFVLDPAHDPHAKAALLAYAESCKLDYPLLAHDVRALAILGPKSQ